VILINNVLPEFSRVLVVVVLNILYYDVVTAGAFLAWADRVFGSYTGHFVIMYVRDLVAATVIYYTTNSLWHLYIYKYKKDQFFPNGKVCNPLYRCIQLHCAMVFELC
jgi:hypothetical protein